MAASRIEWCDRSDWNPIRGCTRASQGCRNCYAESIAARFSDPGQPFHGIAQRTFSGPRWTGKVELVEDRLTLPLRWRKPARVFVNSMFDPFQESVPYEWVDRLFAVMAMAPQHTFLVLTKRADRMRDYSSADGMAGRIWDAADRIACDVNLGESHHGDMYLRGGRRAALWPLRNVWLGVSVEDQANADERILSLLETLAAKRFVSAEPMLGPIDIRDFLSPPASIPGRSVRLGPGNWIVDADGSHTIWTGLNWVIVGGESGHGARVCEINWIRSIVRQCRSANVACFVKQLGARPTLNGFSGPLSFGRKGGDWSGWPEEIRVREFPQ